MNATLSSVSAERCIVFPVKPIGRAWYCTKNDLQEIIQILVNTAFNDVDGCKASE